MKKTLNFSWGIATFLLALGFFLVTMRWSLIDHSPPRWDESLYLLEATMHHQALLSSGIFGYIKSIFTADPGRVPLLTILVEPSFVLFGPTLPAAVIFMGLLWFPLAWAFYKICSTLNQTYIGEIAGFIAFLFFGLYPPTIMLSNYYLVEFLLTTIVLITYSQVVQYLYTRKTCHLWGLGIAIGLGMLTKVTFPVFLVPVGTLFITIFYEEKKWKLKLTPFVIVAITVLILAGSYYVINLTSLIRLTKTLSSSRITELYGFFPAWSLKGATDYFYAVFTQPLLVFVSGGLLFLLIQQLWPKKKLINNGIWIVAIISFVIPFLSVALGSAKDPRYSYPALSIVFILGSLGLVGCLRSIVLFGGILIYSWFLFKPSFFENYFLTQGINFNSNVAVVTNEGVPDPRDWQTVNTIEEITNLCAQYTLPCSILFLGGNRYYHMNLFRYYVLYLKKKEITFIALPYYEKEITFSGAIKFIETHKISAILFKTGENYPPFSYHLTPEIVDYLHHNPHYIFQWLSTTQPDGSRFGIFILKSKP